MVAAAARDNIEALRSLAERGTDVNFKDESKRTRLWAAVDAAARGAVTLLEERGASEW